MLRNGKGRWLESVDRVAHVAPVLVWRGGKLPAMLIHVAIGALRKGDLVPGGRSRRNVALGAGHACVAALQRICRRGMHFHVE